MHFETAYENIEKYTRDDAKSSFVWRALRANAFESQQRERSTTALRCTEIKCVHPGRPL